MKFGQYELRELIAVGGMAEVYKGRVVGAEGFEKWVAIKRILPDLGEDERFVKMLLTEARIHSALSHRNIVQIHDLGISEDGEYFIVLEYVEGYDLRMITDQLSEQGEIIPEALSLHIASELAQALHFAHELRGADGQPLGIVHRDVSPSNVLISLAGEVKLSDFGLAKRRHDRSVVGSLKGNLAYMSPEQARQSRLDRRTDVFSLGAVLFEMLTGKRLREITDEIKGWNQVASGEVPSVRAVRPDLPESFERLLATALAPEPERRYADAASFGVAIRATLAGMNTPVGANDLQLLLSTLSPPRRPRELVAERSKVIRLGPEAQALGEAIAAPVTPAPVVVPVLAPVFAPGMTPAVRRPPGGVTGAPPAKAGERAGEGGATPPPSTPLPPVQPWRATPHGPVPLTRADRLTPPGPLPAMQRGSQPARLHSAASAAAVPVVAAAWGAGSAAAAPALPFEARPSTAEHLPTIAPPSALPSPAFASRARRETARVLVRGGSTWRPFVIIVCAALLLMAGAVHLAVVPLEVLVVWPKPATLTITSEPEGAAVKLDGVVVAGLTPTQATVRRDRFDHVMQLSAPGHRATRQIVRYDGAVRLAVAVRLEKDLPATFEALPSKGGAAPLEATPPRSPSDKPAAPSASTSPSEAGPRAPTPRRRAAAKASKGGKGAAGKTGKAVAGKNAARPAAKRK
jgi:tRNA A-37 threonylcarbamoyl transferase component Bud32